MEFKFNTSMNTLFGNQINCIDRNLTPHRTSPLHIREYKSQLCEVIDKLGQASAKAQGLHGAITTAHRLQLSDHRVYLMKDEDADSVVGFIKVGKKRLFVYDQHGVNHEMEPLCALDFYIHESQQRRGFGHKLFEYMLHAEGIKPHQIAIDRPSHKFLAFLKKYYKLKATVSQVNNFVVFDGFFKDKANNNERRANKPPVHPSKAKRNATAHSRSPITEMVSSERPLSGSGVLLPPLEKTKQILSDVPLNIMSSTRHNNYVNQDPHQKSSLLNGNKSSLAMAAHGTQYSRHTNSKPSTPTGQRGGDAIQSVSNISTGQTNHGGTVGIATIDVTKKVLGGKDPPLRPRESPSLDYRKLFSPDVYNGSNYQDRRGHLKVNDHQINVPSYQRPDNLYNTRPAKPQTIGSTWNVFGIPPNPRVTNAGYQRSQTRLW